MSGGGDALQDLEQERVEAEREDAVPSKRKSWKCCGLVFGIILVIVIGCLLGLASQSSERFMRARTGAESCVQHTATSMRCDGITRSWELAFPMSYDAVAREAQLPLLIVLHGLGGTPASVRLQMRMTNATHGDDAIIAFPAGIGHSWNAGACCGQASKSKVADVAFLRGLIEAVAASFPAIDKKRVYVTGHSNGCMMAQRLAAEASDVVAAVACSSGYLVAASDAAAGLRPMPFLEVHCADDPIVPYQMDVQRRDLFPGALANLKTWSLRNQCAQTIGSNWSNQSSSFIEYSRCAEGVRTAHLVLTQCGHEVYSAQIAENVPAILWGFLRAWSLGD